MEACQLTDSVAETDAGRHCLENLLNCYCREVAGPEGHLDFGTASGQNDWPLALRCGPQDSLAMHLTLPRTRSRVVGRVARVTPSGCYSYRTPFYYRMAGRGWTPLDWRSLARLVLQELALKFEAPLNHELYAQIKDSVATVSRILRERVPAEENVDVMEQFIESEQALVYGHAFHPAPKSREGFSDEDRSRFSPELRVRFPLHYFAVQASCLKEAALGSLRPADVIRTHAPSELRQSELALLPVHPWQARYLLQLPTVKQALRTGTLQDLGQQGAEYAATSSVRTLFQCENPWFYKVSLNVRITNCVRKNAFYELEGALEISRLLQGLRPVFHDVFPRLSLLSEPGYITASLPSEDPAQRIAVEEGFGLILRDGLHEFVAEGSTPVLAGALFARAGAGIPDAREHCARAARRESLPLREVIEEWFAAYAEQLLHPVLDAFFTHGVVFEPHLQNVLVGLRKGWPERLAIRDFEGVKLVHGRFSADRLEGLSERAREALWYDEQRGWNRIAYCLFVNQSCEAVARLSGEDEQLEARLWDIVRQSLVTYQVRHGCARSNRAIRDLLHGAVLPAKCNLLNRVRRRPDRAAEYAPFPNPLVREVM